MKNYKLDIYFTDALSLAGHLEKCYVNTIFFENVTCEITKREDKHKEYDVIRFYKRGKIIAMFFPNDHTDYEIREEN